MPDDAAHTSPFERIRHTAEDGGEYWSARDLAAILGYSGWQRFTSVLERAMQACENSGHAASDHFNATVKMIATGKGAQREVEDIHLSRYACYLVVQNADPAKEIVALGQTYFAVRTREAEIADELAQLSEDQRRLRLRAEMKERNVDLAAAASGAGIITARDFALFQDHGYRGLYNGETARDIAARKGLKRGQAILDHMGSTELAANWFRATQAADKITREGVTTKDAANRIHHDVGRKVRQTIADLGGTMPEDLPTPAKSIAELQRDEAQRVERERQPILFPPDDDSTGNSGQP